MLRERARASVSLRAYIYNALFTTAKPPKIRLSVSFFLSFPISISLSHVLSLRLAESLVAPHPDPPCPPLSSRPPSPVSRPVSPSLRGVTVSFIRASQLTDTALCPFVSLLAPFIPFVEALLRTSVFSH